MYSSENKKSKKQETLESPFARHIITLLSRRNSWDIKTISFVIFLCYGIRHMSEWDQMTANPMLRVLQWNIRFCVVYIVQSLIQLHHGPFVNLTLNTVLEQQCQIQTGFYLHFNDVSERERERIYIYNSVYCYLISLLSCSSSFTG